MDDTTMFGELRRCVVHSVEAGYRTPGAGGHIRGERLLRGQAAATLTSSRHGQTGSGRWLKAQEVSLKI